MENIDLIDYVVPRGGIYNVVGMRKGKRRPRRAGVRRHSAPSQVSQDVPAGLPRAEGC